MPGTDLFFNYADDLDKKTLDAHAFEMLKAEVHADDRRRRGATGATTEEIPEPPPGNAPEGYRGYPIRRTPVDIMGAPDIMGAVDPLGGVEIDPGFKTDELGASHVLSKDTIGSTFRKGGRQVIGGAIKGVGGAIRNAAENFGIDAGLGAVDGAINKVGLSNPGLLEYKKVMNGLRSAIGLDAPLDAVSGLGSKIAKKGEEINQSNLSSAGTSYLQQRLQDSVASLGLSFSVLGLTFLTKNPMLGLSILGVTSGGQQYQDSREFGDSPNWSRFVSGLVGSIEVATEKIPMEKGVKAIAAGAQGKIAKAVQEGLAAYGFDMGGELAATLGQDLAAKMSNRPDLTEEELKSDVVDTFWSTLFMGPMQLAATGAIGGAAKLTARTDIGPRDFKGYVEQNFKGATVEENKSGATVTLPSGGKVEIHTAASPMAAQLQEAALARGDAQTIAKVKSGATGISGVFFKAGDIVGTEGDLIYLTGLSDLTTLPHEKAHLVASMMKDVLTSEEAKAIGLPEEGAVPTDVEEKMATEFEKYAYKRTASPEKAKSPLDKAFEKVIDLAHGIYSAFGGPTNRLVFEKMRTGEILQREGATKEQAEKMVQRSASYQVKEGSVTTTAGEFPLDHNGWKFEGEMMGYYQYTLKDPNRHDFTPTILVDKPENLQKKIDLTLAKFEGPKLQTRPEIADRLRQASNAAYREKRTPDVAGYYKPGNLVYDRYWNSMDVVLNFKDLGGGNWETTVVQVDAEGNPLGPERKHATRPDRGDYVIGNLNDLKSRGRFLDQVGLALPEGAKALPGGGYPRFQTRTPGPKGLTVNFTDAEVSAIGEELLRGAFEKLQFTQTNDVSMQKAQDLIKAGKMNLDTFLNHDPFTAWPDTATQVAAEMIAGGVFDYVKTKIGEWRDGKITADEARQARMVGMGAIASWYLPQSEVGRMLQARQMAITPEGIPVQDLMAEQMKFEKDLQEMIDKGMISPEEELEAIDKFYSVDQMMNFRKRVAKTKDVSILNQLFYFSLLSNPVTQTANIVGNVGPLFFAIADQYVSEKMPFSSTPKGGTAGMMAGLYHTVLEAFILSGRAAYTGETSMGSDKFRNPRVTGIESVDQARESIKQIMEDKTHPFHDPSSDGYQEAKRGVMLLHRKAYNPISGERMARITSGAIDSDSPLARTLDILGEMIDAPFKGLAAGDEFFKVLNHQLYVWKSAYEMAVTNSEAWAAERGIPQERAFDEYVANFVDDPPSTVESLAREFAAKQTFTSEPGPIASVFQTWTREYPIFRVIVPFVTVIGNIAKYNMEHTPFAYFFRQVKSDIKSGGKARDMALSKMAVGSSMMLAFAGLAAAGLITGGGPSDPKLKKLWSQKDSNGNVAWQEYSFKIGGTWISYKRIEPFATPIGVAADIVEILKFAPRVNIAEAMIGGAIAFTRNFTSKTYAQGISNFLEAITSGGGDTMQSNAARWLRSTSGILIPGGIAQVARVMDPVVRDTHDWIDSLKARVPGLSQSLEPARNLKGDVMTVGMYDSIPGKVLGMVNPFMYAGTTGDIVTKEILRNRVPLTMPSRRLGGGRNPDSAMFDEGNTAIDLTPAQYGWFVMMAGNGLKDPKTGRGMWDTLTAIISGVEPVDPGGNGRPRLYYAQKNPDGTPVFTDGPEGGKAAIIEKIVHTYRNKVRDMIENGDVFPEVRNEYISKSVGRKIKRVPQIGGAR